MGKKRKKTQKKTKEAAQVSVGEIETESSRAEDVDVDEDYNGIENDCEVANDEDTEAIEDVVDGVEELNGHGGIVEEGCCDLALYFGDTARDDVNDEEVSDADSGDFAWDDNKIPDPLSSDEEDEEQSRPGLTYRENVDPEALLALGKTYSSAEEFKHALLRYTLKTRYNIKLYKSSALRLGAKCGDPDSNCPWKVYCSYERRKQKLMIKLYVGEHECMKTGFSKFLKRSTIASLFAERLRLNPKMTKYEMSAEIRREYGMIVSEDACGKAKTKVMKERKASHEEHFSRIWDYQAELLRSNPGSSIDIETIPGPTIGSKQRFFRIYICFESQRTSWKNTCRPIIGLDGAFLKWDIKGHLLAAVGRDGDNRIVPIAWAVVEIENDTNWDWFVRHLASDLGLEDGKSVAILSDKQKGLVKAIHTILPKVEHRQCCRHIFENWKKGSHDMKLQRLFWCIARSYTTADYAHYMEELKKYTVGAYASLEVTNPESWARAFFRLGSLCNDNLNNLCESFNRTIRLARKKPLLDMLEEIRRQCMVRNAKRQIIANRLKSMFTKRTMIEIGKMKYLSKECSRYLSVGNKIEVDHKGVSYEVDMDELTCGCKKWQMTGIPCIHATSVIISRKQRVANYVAPCYTKAMWCQTYSTGIKPVQGMKLWPRTNRLGVLPPPWRKGNPGRPSNYDRRKGRYETVPGSNNTRLSRTLRIITCSNCKEEGHNKSTCKNDAVQSLPKRPRGRPKKNQEGFYYHEQLSQGSFSQSSQQASQQQASQEQASQQQASQQQASQEQASQQQASQQQASQPQASQPQASQPRAYQAGASHSRWEQRSRNHVSEEHQGWAQWFL